MLSLKHCRAILGPYCTLNDDELQVRRDSMYSVAGLVVHEFQKKRTSQKDIKWEGVDKSLFEKFSQDELESLDERAAIMEHDGGLSRKDAEKAAILSFEELRRRHEEGRNLL